MKVILGSKSPRRKELLSKLKKITSKLDHLHSVTSKIMTTISTSI